MFKIGEKVVCIKQDKWEKANENPFTDFINLPDPIYNEVYTICNIFTFNKDVYLYFTELNGTIGYNSKEFRKLDYDFVEDVIKKVTEEPIIIQ